MKWRYMITYGCMKPGLTDEQLVKEMDKYKADLEKAGIKLVLWGHPFGTTEDMVAVLDLNGDMNKFLKVTVDPPFTGSRTNTVIER